MRWILLLLLVPIAMACDCPDADLVYEVDMGVVGIDCMNIAKPSETIDIDVPVPGTHTVKGVVLRGNPGQCQTNEDFYLIVNGVSGPETEDDADPCAQTVRLDELGSFSFINGTNTVTMHTAAQCPPDTSANSVHLQKLCIYYGDNDVPEFGLVGLALAAIGATGLILWKRR